LAACLWALWLERNRRVFNTSPSSRAGAANIYFLVLHLFQYSTGSSANLAHFLVVDVETAMPSSAPSALTPPGCASSIAVAHPANPIEDEDLLD
jgi:hypothetical protein